MKKNREVLVSLPETKVWIGIVLYTDKTYEYVNAAGECIGTGEWKQQGKSICITFGFYWNCLNDQRPDLNDLIAWEQIEREILS